MDIVLNNTARKHIRDAVDPFKIVDTKRGTFLVNKNDQYLGRSLLKYGQFLDQQCILFKSCLKHVPKLAVDAGANIGVFSVVMGKALEGKAEVIALEPYPPYYYQLCSNMLLNDLQNVRCLMLGASDIKETRSTTSKDIHLVNNFGDTVFTNQTSNSNNLKENQQNSLTTTAHFTTLDEILDGLDPGFIKLDVEYMEIDAIRGASDTLKRCKPIIYTENIFHGINRPEMSKMLIEEIWSFDYECYWHISYLHQYDNFFKDEEVIFCSNPEKEQSYICSVDMLCVPKDMPVKFDLQKIIDASENPLKRSIAVD